MTTQQIAIIRQRYHAAGGAEQFINRTLPLLIKNNLQITLLTRDWPKIEGLSVICINPFYKGSLWRDYGFSQALQRTIKQHRFALVQTHERIAGCDIFRAGDGVHQVWLNNRKQRLGLLSRMKLWMNPYHHYVCYTEKKLFLDPSIKAIICNSQMVYNEIYTLFQVPKDKLHVIYNGVDTTHFHPSCRNTYRHTIRQQYHIPQTAPVLIYAGSGFSRKGVDTALRAIINYPELHLLIVGEDKKRHQYERQANALGIKARCHFAGAQKKMVPFYGAADALILPTLYDPFPNVCIEALACGLPLLTSLQCGAAELITPNVNGWVSDALDSKGWSPMIGQWLAMRPQWDSLRFCARKTAEPLTLDKMTQKLVTLYQKLLS